MPFSVRTFAAIPPEGPDPIMRTSTISSAMVSQFPRIACCPNPVTQSLYFASSVAQERGAGRTANSQPTLAMVLARDRIARRSSTFSVDIGLDGIPIQPHAFVPFARCIRGLAPRLRINRRRANVAMGHIDEVSVRFSGRMIRHPGLHPGLKQLIRLCLLHLGKRHAKMLLGLGVQPIETRLIHLLAICG